MCDGLESEQRTEPVVQLQQVVDRLLKDENTDDLDKCVAESLDECERTKHYPCGLCTKVCKSKVGLILHSRAKHPGEVVAEKIVSPTDSKSVEKIASDATKLLTKCDICGLTVKNVFINITFQPTNLLIQTIQSLYAEFCK